MPDKTKEQLTLDNDIFSQPDASIPVPIRSPDAKTRSKARKKAAKKPAPNPQAFLPGLSRRGRPRSSNPVPATVRATESRKRRIEAGVKRVELLVAPEIAADLDLLTEHFRISRVEILSRLIAKAAKRIRDQSR